MSGFNVNPEISLEEGVQLYETRMQQAVQTLAQKGFVMSQAPSYQTAAGVMPYRGELPQDLTSLTDSQLGTYMGLLSEWNTYVQAQLAEAASNLLKTKSELALVEAKLRIAYKNDDEGKKRSNPERDDYMCADRRYVQAQSQVIYWDTIYHSVRAIALGAENAFSAVSRRITQRGQDIERERKNQGLTGGANVQHGAYFGRGGR